jgi:hypothetical protein
MTASRDTPESITRDELEAYYKRMTHAGGELTEGAADRVFANILAHREPEYEPGAMYRDADGKIWLYLPERNYACAGSWADCPWLKPGDAASYSLNSPKRPLHRLVPEAPRPSEADVLAVIVAWTNESNLYQNLAYRMCRLFGASDD